MNRPDYLAPVPDEPRVPPHSIQAEQCVVGGVFRDNRAWPDAASLLEAGDFYQQAHQIIFRAISSLAEEGSPLDVVTVAEKLESARQLDEVGGMPYLGALAKAYLNNPCISHNLPNSKAKFWIVLVY